MGANREFTVYSYPEITRSPDQTRCLRWNYWNTAEPIPIGVYDAASGELLFEIRQYLQFQDHVDVWELNVLARRWEVEPG